MGATDVRLSNVDPLRCARPPARLLQLAHKVYLRTAHGVPGVLRKQTTAWLSLGERDMGADGRLDGRRCWRRMKNTGCCRLARANRGCLISLILCPKHARLLRRRMLFGNEGSTSSKAAYTKENEGAPTDRQSALHGTAAGCVAKQEVFVDHFSIFALEFQNRCLHLAFQLSINDCDCQQGTQEVALTIFQPDYGCLKPPPLSL